MSEICFILILMMAMLMLGHNIGESQRINGNHNTQEQCEYEHETKCINAWIKESMQNPKSKGELK